MAPAPADLAAVERVPMGQWWKTNVEQKLAGGIRVHAEAVAPLRAYGMAAGAIHQWGTAGVLPDSLSLVTRRIRLQI